MVNLYVGITDYDWFQFLSVQPNAEEVNFWQPGGRINFRALQPGELFLFKLHAPRNFIVGGGVFAHADILPVSIAWEAFGIKNGAPTLAEMRKQSPSIATNQMILVMTTDRLPDTYAAVFLPRTRVDSYTGVMVSLHSTRTDLQYLGK